MPRCCRMRRWRPWQRPQNVVTGGAMALNRPLALLHEGLLRPAWCFVYRPRSADEDVRYTLSVDAVTGEPIDFGTDLCDLKPSEIPDH